MDIKKREKIAMGSYSVANVCLRGIKKIGRAHV